MKIAAMQPYLFPYIGYFQLIGSVDVFVILDDVNYINRGWINRNRIKGASDPFLITLQLNKASQNRKINEIAIGGNLDKLLATIRNTYANARFFGDVFPIIERILGNSERNLARFNSFSLNLICNYLGIRTSFLYSSELNLEPSLRGEDRILSIVELLHGHQYHNPIGGVDLYSKDRFQERGIDLHFIEPCLDMLESRPESEGQLSFLHLMMHADSMTLARDIQRFRFR